MKVFLFALVVSIPVLAKGDNILLLCNQGISHCNEIAHIGQGLQERGHSLFIILQSRVPGWYRQSIVDRNITVLEHKIGDDVPVFSSDESNKDKMVVALTLNFNEVYHLWAEATAEICQAMLEDDALPLLVKDSNITFAVVDCFYMYPCLPIVVHRLDLPFVCRVTSL